MWKIATLLIAIGWCSPIDSYYGFPLITEPMEIWDILKENSTSTTFRKQDQSIQVYPGEECDRKCTVGEPSRVCYFHWVLENYSAMGSACWDCLRGNRAHCFHPQCITANGMERAMVAINRKMPGPPIFVCRGDTIVVDVSNEMEGMSNTIHWHGFHQLKSPWMDGVPMLTQCPIAPSSSFRYTFQAEEPGTQWYHSHAGYHMANGHLGVAVVRNPLDVNADLYDFDLSEHVILLSDWTLDSVERWVPGQQSTQMKVDSILVNGRGRYSNIEKHQKTIISTDGGAVKPHTVDTLISISGERYDFVLTANQPPGNYWVRVRGIGFCNSQRVEGLAILSYADSSIPTEKLMFPEQVPPSYDSPYPLGRTLNHHMTECYKEGDDFTCAADLEAHEVHRDHELIDSHPDVRLFLGFKVIEANNSMLFTPPFTKYATVRNKFNTIGVANNISFISPSFPLLIQPELIVDENTQFCNNSHLPSGCDKLHTCYCTHRLKVKHNVLVEFVLYDTAFLKQDFYHPFHLHGHRFIITDMGMLPDEAKTLRLKYLQEREFTRRPNSHNPPYKDTISIPNEGYVKVRFRANNAGFWLVHCHFEWHLGTGMGLVLQVGEPYQMLKAPPDFPRCGDYGTKQRASGHP
ncbi:AAEL001672-PA [Aedes aegypti]|uniref:AAEL001672-PA n=1 Tax=Aedes aegypti TaxID=7159 RepID=Q17KM4_AEDAE|nr:AAEL001672-PA [Aedes aegypti]